ncbi:MAG: DUF1232 domain-containing protein [Deltaproteobacteria bacterium]|nr:DUF1232 domain-containing protein [Deltaproteobacteria bacterium]
MDETELADVAERWLTSLQQDLKDFLHVVCDDQDLDEGLRAMAVSAVLYTLAPGDVIPDSSGVPGYIDDALALRVVLARIRERFPERFDGYAERIPELAASTGEDLDAFRAWLGDLYELFATRVGAVEKNEFKGKHAQDLLADPDGATWLEEEVSVAALKLDFKPQAVASAARRVNTLLPTFKQKLQSMRK